MSNDPYSFGDMRQMQERLDRDKKDFKKEELKKDQITFIKTPETTYIMQCISCGESFTTNSNKIHYCILCILKGEQ